MHFSRTTWEQRFQMCFNRGCVRTDLMYAVCLASFALSALYRLRQVPGTAGIALAATPLLMCAPMLLLLSTLCPALYERHRQPIVVTIKVWAAFVGSLLPSHFSGSLAAALVGCDAGAPPGSTPTGMLAARAGMGLTGQLVLHALGLQTTGAWLIFSQGFVVAASVRTASYCCGCRLAPAVQRLLLSRPLSAVVRYTSLGSTLLDSTPPQELCEAYILGLQLSVGFFLTTLVGLVSEWRQRFAFAAVHRLPPPSRLDLFALHGCFLSMFFLILRVALSEVSYLRVLCGGKGGADALCGIATCPLAEL